MSEFSKLNGYDVKDKKAVRYYDNVSLMKADTTIKVGQCIKTLGYHDVNDGGSAEYIIVDNDNLIADDGLIHDLSNGLKAKLIFNKYIMPEQFGAYGDNIHDDTIPIQKSINTGYKVYLSDKTYYISNYLNLVSDLNISGGKNTKIHCAEHTVLGNQPIININNVSNVTISNLYVYSNKTQTDSRGQLTSNRNAFQFNNSHDIRVINCRGLNLHSFIWISQTSENECNNIEILSCETYETHEPVYINYTKNLTIEDMISSQCDDSVNLSHHLYINGKCENITINNWEAKKSPNVDYGYLINISDSNNTGYVPDNIKINNFNSKEASCSFLAIAGGQSTIDKLGNIEISNCSISKPIDKTYGGSHKRQVIYGGTYYNLIMNNCNFSGYSNFGELNRYNELKNRSIFRNCYFYFSGITTNDFDGITGNLLFDNCQFNYDLDGNFKIINKGSSTPYIERLIFKNCLFNILTNGTWLVQVNDKYSHVDFIDCILQNNNISSGYFQANSGTDTANNVTFNNTSLIGFDSAAHGGTSARQNNGYRLDTSIE